MKNSLLLLQLALLLIILTGCGEPEISQSISNVELGNNMELLDTITYDSSVVSKVIVTNDGNFDTNKIGDYIVTFLATSNKGKTAEYSYNYVVVDTIAPEISIKKENMLIQKDSNISFGDIVSVDEISEYEIKWDGILNASEVGQYNIELYAVDSSNNSSEKVSFNVEVFDRTDADFEIAYYGDSIETIEKYEQREVYEKHTNLNMYNGMIYNTPCYICYYFNEKGELYEGGYFTSQNYINGLSCYNTYVAIKEQMIKKYGKAKEEDDKVIIEPSLYPYADNDSNALEIGYIQYWSSWETNKEIIDLWCSIDDYYNLSVNLTYTSKNIER